MKCEQNTLHNLCILLLDYHCGSDLGWSDLFYFMNRRYTDVNWSPVFAIYGDMGSENARSIPRLERDVINRKIDVAIHVGDFAYDLNSVSMSCSVLGRVVFNKLSQASC